MTLIWVATLGLGTTVIYPRSDDIIGGATGSILCSLSPPVFSHKMVHSPLKMADCENKMAAVPWFPWDSCMSLALLKLKAGAAPGSYETKIYTYAQTWGLN